MKISAYHKIGGADVFLKTDYDNLESFDKVFISKVFTDTPIDDKILHLENVQYGGTGFFYDLAPKLPDEIEHIFLIITCMMIGYHNKLKTVLNQSN